MRRTNFTVSAILAAIGGSILAAFVFAIGTNTGAQLAPSAAPSDMSTSTSFDWVTEEYSGPLTFAVDESVSPDTPSVEGLAPGDALRPTGRIVYSDGEGADLVLGELVVSTSDDVALAGFLARNNGELLESSERQDGEPTDYLVQIPLSDVDPGAAAQALAELEPDHSGTYVVSDPLLVSMMFVAATETLEYGIDVSLNWLTTATGIVDGDVQDAEDRPNPFDWGYLKVGGPLDTGVSGAWQLIEQYGKADNKVRVMIADGGFFENDDLPSQRKIRLGKWNVKNPGTCTGGSSCPTHGTEVALTALAKIDNGFGTAGVAGQVGELIAVQLGGDFWTQMRKIKKVVGEERPAVVNMSFGMEVRSFRNASERSVDRHLKAMRDDGALIFAAAGNDGKDVDGRVCIWGKCYENRLVIPCESKYAICVGGTQNDSAWLHSASNRGTAGGDRSVQIYAPFCVVSLFNPISQTIDDTKTACGTSVSSPFVAGAAALVKAADPNLSSGEIWSILKRNAHIGGVNFDHYIATEDQLRINVMDAVADALGVEQTGPQVQITSPLNGDEVGVTDWFELSGNAVDFKGQPLPLRWESSIDGDLGTQIEELTVWELTAGSHTITATATDVNGVEQSDSIVLEVIDLPPDMAISWPAPGSFVYETADITLIGSSKDPDTYQTLPDGDVEWEVTRNGNVAFSGTGHVLQVPGGTLQPGAYKVIFRGSDGGGTGEAETSMQVLEVVGEIPVATITTQFTDAPYGLYNGVTPGFTLSGNGVDAEDGLLPGTQYRWIARADNGYEMVLCKGSSYSGIVLPDEGGFNPGLAVVPSGFDPAFEVLIDCGNVDVELGLAPGAVAETVWAVVLEVVDSDGQVGVDVASVTIRFVTG